MYSFLQRRREAPNIKEMLKRTPAATAEAFGLSSSTVRRNCKEAQVSVAAVVKTSRSSRVPEFTSPSKELFRAKPVTALDDLSKDVCRQTLFQFYCNREYPTRKKLVLLVESLNLLDLNTEGATMEENVYWNYATLRQHEMCSLRQNQVHVQLFTWMKRG